jgi:hypothetical protein
MKKFSMFICAVMLVFGMVGVSGAVPTTWTDTIDWNPDQRVGFWGSFGYYHDISDGVDGFVGILDGGNDIVNTYSLTVALYDDYDRRDQWELAYISQPGVLGDGFYNFNYSNQTYDWSIAGLIDINHDGTLNVSINSWWGDFNLDWSTLVARGDNGTETGTAPVPEPSTILLMGTGILGLVAYGRKRYHKKA